MLSERRMQEITEKVKTWEYENPKEDLSLMIFTIVRGKMNGFKPEKILECRNLVNALADEIGVPFRTLLQWDRQEEKEALEWDRQEQEEKKALGKYNKNPRASKLKRK